MTEPSFNITNESITVVVDGEPHNVKKGSPNFGGLYKALIEKRWWDVEKFLTINSAVKDWSKGRFVIYDDIVQLDGKYLPIELTQRILQLAASGSDPTPVFRFWERLQLNPSFRSVHQLWGFLKQVGIPLTQDGCFLAYKSVSDDYRDHYSGAFDNSPGTVLEMPRNEISDDPNVACHEGFHVGALEYAQNAYRGFPGARIIICKVDPQHVVCVPFDHSQQKMRVCKYLVLGNYGATLPETVYDDGVHPLVDEDENSKKDLDLLTKDICDHSKELDEVRAENEESVAGRKKTSMKLSLAMRDKAPPKKWLKKYTDMQAPNMLHCSVDELRKYATYGLDIIAASKIPGGKLGLISRIIEVRDGVKRRSKILG